MLSFLNDYSETACSEIIRRLQTFGTEKNPGYGSDTYTETAKQKIRDACACPSASVYFLVGGTQTNAAVLDTILRLYEGVIAAETGHINVHESGAVEFTGHKVLSLSNHAGKIDPSELSQYLQSFFAEPTYEHMVIPGAVYLSQPTEYGTLYTKAELTEIRRITEEYGIRLYLDGARLGYGLAAPGNDLFLPDLSKLCDAFYIGGTKQGALFGEAVVFPKEAPKHFLSIMKQHGALLAKGFLLGLQFDTLFTDGLYVRLAKRAVDLSVRLREIFRETGYRIEPETVTNQSFVVIDKTRAEELSREVLFEYWCPYSETENVYRFVCGVTTAAEDVEKLAEYL